MERLKEGARGHLRERERDVAAPSSTRYQKAGDRLLCVGGEGGNHERNEELGHPRSAREAVQGVDLDKRTAQIRAANEIEEHISRVHE